MKKLVYKHGISYSVSCLILVVLLFFGSCVVCHGQRFVGAYGYAPYGGMMNQGARRGNTLYGGMGWSTGGYTVYMGRYAGRGYNGVQARRYLAWRRQHRSPALDRPLPYTLNDLERDFYNNIWWLEHQRCYDPFWDENPSGRQQ